LNLKCVEPSIVQWEPNPHLRLQKPAFPIWLPSTNQPTEPSSQVKAKTAYHAVVHARSLGPSSHSCSIQLEGEGARRVLAQRPTPDRQRTTKEEGFEKEVIGTALSR